MFYKRFLGFLACFSLFVSISFAGAQEISPEDAALFSDMAQSEADRLVDYLPPTDDEVALASVSIYDYLYDSLMLLEERIDLTSYEYTKDDPKALSDDYITVLNMHPELYYVSRGYRYYWNGEGKIGYLEPTYTTRDRRQINDEIFRIQLAMDRYLTGIDDSMSDLEKLMVIHDRLVFGCEYDESLTRHAARDLLVDGIAVCQGYACAFYALADRVGIKSGFVTSGEMNHIWNVFCIDGEWYHADATWDDPLPDMYSRINHKYFLKSNQAMLQTHTDFPLIEGASAKYDDAFWNPVRSPIIPLGGVYFYILQEGKDVFLRRYSTNSGDTRTLYRFEKPWNAGPGYIWNTVFSGLGYHDGRLYFNTADAVYSTDLYGRTLRAEPVSLSQEERAAKNLYGLFVWNDYLYTAVGERTSATNAVSYGTPLFLGYPQRRLYVCDAYKIGLEKHTVYVNQQLAPATFAFYEKKNGRLSQTRFVRASDMFIDVAVPGEFASSTLAVWDEQLRPLCELQYFFR